MKYVKQHFVIGMKVSLPDVLNRMEDGIAAACGAAVEGIGTVTTGDTPAAGIRDGKLCLTLPRGEPGPQGNPGEGLSDNEIANKLGIKASTVRHQKFTFREKAKQAKYYLAVYEEVFGDGGKARKADDIVDIPNTATMMDDRYVITGKERERILKSEFESMRPLRLRHYPLKAKKQVVVLSEVAKLFELGKKYTEAETREMLAAVYEDYSMLRRYLVDYGFMGRTKDGTEYWLK